MVGFTSLHVVVAVLMSIPVIVVCLLLILAYIFDITSSKTKIPSVILLFGLGWAVRQGTDFFAIPIPALVDILPILGTVGLILIVLEGSLELELNRGKFPYIGKMAVIAFLPILIFSFSIAFAFHYFGQVPFRSGLINAVPFAVISSSIAIPSAQNLLMKDKEFVTYESSLSDIFGVIMFNFITLNDNIGTDSFSNFFGELLLILLISSTATIALAFLLSKIKHPVKFVPIILIIILIYEISKVYHLPALIFILLFGLTLGNLDEIKRSKLILRLHPEILNKEVHKLKELTAEISFLIRALFFLVFGFLLDMEDLLNPETIVWALSIVSAVLVIRFVFLKLFRLPIQPLLFIAPRGLITILLFLSIPVAYTIDIANKSLTIQVIILTALLMMIGLILAKKPDDQISMRDEANLPDEEENANEVV